MEEGPPSDSTSIKLQRPVQDETFTFENTFVKVDLTWSREANKIIKNTIVLSKFILNGAGEFKSWREREFNVGYINTLAEVRRREWEAARRGLGMGCKTTSEEGLCFTLLWSCSAAYSQAKAALNILAEFQLAFINQRWQTLLLLVWTRH